jgi:hypothetical protein
MQWRTLAMKFPALFAILVAGASSVASAEPKQTENSGRVSYNDKAGGPPAAAHRDGDVVELADATPTQHGKEFITVGRDAGRFSELRVEAQRGKVILRRVRIDYVDGKSQNIVVDKVLAKQNPLALIPVKRASEIEQVVITTERDTKGTYAVHGVLGASNGGVASR